MTQSVKWWHFVCWFVSIKASRHFEPWTTSSALILSCYGFDLPLTFSRTWFRTVASSDCHWKQKIQCDRRSLLRRHGATTWASTLAPSSMEPPWCHQAVTLTWSVCVTSWPACCLFSGRWRDVNLLLLEAVVTCWPTCRPQVTPPPHLSFVCRWTLDFGDVRALFSSYVCMHVANIFSQKLLKWSIIVGEHQH